MFFDLRYHKDPCVDSIPNENIGHQTWNVKGLSTPIRRIKSPNTEKKNKSRYFFKTNKILWGSEVHGSEHVL